jgi:hypothetical protein
MGNLFAVFIWIFAISSSFKITKRSYKIIENLSEDIIDTYRISLMVKNANDKNNYPVCS